MPCCCSSALRSAGPVHRASCTGMRGRVLSLNPALTPLEDAGDAVRIPNSGCVDGRGTRISAKTCFATLQRRYYCVPLLYCLFGSRNSIGISDEALPFLTRSVMRPTDRAAPKKRIRAIDPRRMLFTSSRLVALFSSHLVARQD